MTYVKSLMHWWMMSTTVRLGLRGVGCMVFGAVREGEVLSLLSSNVVEDKVLMETWLFWIRGPPHYIWVVSTRLGLFTNLVECNDMRFDAEMLQGSHRDR